MFIAALFTMARTWKQPKCPSAEEQTKKMWCVYAMEYYSAVKRNKTGSFVEMQMGLETVTQSEVKSLFLMRLPYRPWAFWLLKKVNQDP